MEKYNQQLMDAIMEGAHYIDRFKKGEKSWVHLWNFRM